MRVKTGIGQDSHRFENASSTKPLWLGAVLFTDCPGLNGNSDADVILHALTNAISSITGHIILGAASDILCLEQGITDSRVYLQEALKYLGTWRISHVALSIEAKRPHFSERIPEIKQSLAQLLTLDSSDIGITATSGEGLTAFGRGEGIQVFACVTAISDT
jgi:2-C-methyl-D-erythritol 2,4-cyclodiphosphate synthase